MVRPLCKLQYQLLYLHFIGQKNSSSWHCLLLILSNSIFYFREESLMAQHQLSTQIHSQPYCVDWLLEPLSLFWTINLKNLSTILMSLIPRELFTLSSPQLWLVESTLPFFLQFILIPQKSQLQWTLGLIATSTNGYLMIDQRSLKVVYKWQLFVGQSVLGFFHQLQSPSSFISRQNLLLMKFSTMPLLLKFQMIMRK